MDQDNYNQRVFGMFGGKDKYEESIERLVDFAGISRTDQVLELCCGTGISTKYILHQTPHVVAVEPNEKRVAEAQRHLQGQVEILTMNALQLGEEHEQRYERVLCINGFHYFNPENFYSLTRRVTRLGGELVFNVKLHDHLGIRPLHYRAYEAYNAAIEEVYRLIERKKRHGKVSDRGFLISDYKPEDFNDFLGKEKLFRILYKQINTVLYDTEEAKQNYWGYWVGILKDFFWHGHNYAVSIGVLEEIMQRHLRPLLESLPKEELLGKAELFVKAG